MGLSVRAQWAAAGESLSGNHLKTMSCDGAPMFGPRLTSVFASRWKALWWAGSILLLTWSLVPSAEDRDPHQPEKPAHVDPWAKDAN